MALPILPQLEDLFAAAGERQLYARRGADGTLDEAVLADSLGRRQRLALDRILVVRAEAGVALRKGVPVYLKSIDRGLPVVSKAKGNSLGTLPAVGLVLENIPAGATGRVLLRGLLTLDTSLWAEGSSLYVSEATEGLLTVTAPSGQNYAQRCAYVLKRHTSEGMLFVVSEEVVRPSGAAATGEEFLPIFTGQHATNSSSYVRVASLVADWDGMDPSLVLRWNQFTVPATSAQVRLYNVTDAVAIATSGLITTTGLKSLVFTAPAGIKLIELQHLRTAGGGGGRSTIEAAGVETR